MKTKDKSLVCVNKYAMLKARVYYTQRYNMTASLYHRSSRQIIQYFKITGGVLLNDSRLKECEDYWENFYKTQSEL